ncbi:hypothetical protein KV205_02535 [Streptomyces sp. SKN60]|uniref:hypothetical protein n=1 Tax=Streptomyces sp. SKN60 TaxID=2855506 RepID=UPI0035AB9A23|nr:hypothetical protein [Streptomyces sp. SKN60]
MPHLEERAVSSSTETENRPGRRGPLLVASVAAGVLLVGGGGVYYAATASGDGSGTAGAGAAKDAAAAPPPLKLGGADTGGPGIAPGEPDPGGGPDGTVYEAKGPLPHGPSSAAVHRPEGRVTSAEVTRLAAALGLRGEPRLIGEVWRLDPEKDTTGLRLDVSAKAPGSWTLSRYDGGPVGDSCLKGKACPPPGEAKPPTGGGSPVSEAAARAAAAPVLKAIGQDDAKVDASQVMNGSERVVNADPVVGGLPTYGWSTGLHIGPDGSVVAGSGRLKEPAKGDTYPVVGAEKALAELNEASKGTGPVGIGGCATDPPASTDGQPGGKPGIAPDAPCQTTVDTAPPNVVEVTGARFGLAAQYVDGEQVLVPAWLFEARAKADAKPYTVARTAVDARYLAPPAKPSPAPTTPPDQGTAPVRQITSFTVDPGGRKLSVTFWGGVCSDYTVTAEESPRQVVVRIAERAKEPGRACIMVAVEITRTVTLQAPLGDRPVVDGASHEAVPRP